MSLALLLPAGLAALAALAMPLLIHLARRTQQRPTDFAALRWLRPRPRPQHRPRFDEWPLLLVRLLLLALLGIAVARPVLVGAAAPVAWVAVVPGADPAGAAALAGARGRAAWLAPGFPPLTVPAATGPVPVASLVRELDAELPPRARLTVLVPPVIEGADAERPRTARRVKWRMVPGHMAAPRPAPAKVPALAIRYDAGVPGLAYLRAAAAALRPAGAAPDVAGVAAPLPAGGALAWLAPGTVPAAVRDLAVQGGTVLLPSGATPLAGVTSVVWRDAAGVPLAEAVTVGRGRLVRFTRPLVPAAMPVLAEPGFPAALAALLGRVAPAPGRVAAADYAPVPGAAAPAATVVDRDLRPPLALLIAAVLLAERWLATRARRAAAP